MDQILHCYGYFKKWSLWKWTSSRIVPQDVTPHVLEVASPGHRHRWWRKRKTQDRGCKVLCRSGRHFPTWRLSHRLLLSSFGSYVRLSACVCPVARHLQPPFIRSVDLCRRLGLVCGKPTAKYQWIQNTIANTLFLNVQLFRMGSKFQE